MNTTLYGLFLLTAAATVFSPGPGVLMTIMKSVRFGYGGAIWTICGTASGTIIMALVSATGLGIVLSHSPGTYGALRVLGALYMVWLGWKSWNAKGLGFKLADKEIDKLKPEDFRDAIVRPILFFMEGITLQMTNPMLIMFFVSLFPQFIAADAPFWPQFALLSGTYFLLVILIHTGYSLVTSHFRGLLRSERASRIIYRTGSVLFWLLSVKVFADVVFPTNL